MALERSVTPTVSPTYWLDQVEVAVELPMGPAGEQGIPGDRWIVTPDATPPTDEHYPDGTLCLTGDGKVYQMADGVWDDTGVDLSAEIAIDHKHDQFVEKTGDTMTGPLIGEGGAIFSGTVKVPTPPDSSEPERAVNIAYLTNQLTALELRRFFGIAGVNAISTSGGWNNAQMQAIYQQDNLGQNVPAGVTGRTVGLVMHPAANQSVQIISDVTNNRWFTRTKDGAQWGLWSPLTPVVSAAAPLDPSAGGPTFLHGTIWIQVDNTVVP